MVFSSTEWRLVKISILSACLALGFTPGSVTAFGQTPRPPADNVLSRIDALNARVTALESALVALTPQVTKLETGEVTADDIVGTWEWASLGVDLLDNPLAISVESGDPVLLTFNADGTGQFSSVNGGSCTVSEGVVSCQPESGSAPFQWSVSNGILTVIDDNDEFSLLVGAGARVMVASTLVSGGNGFRHEGFGYIGVVVKLTRQ